MCRAELRVETPGGAWTARLASRIFDDPAALPWDDAGLIVGQYGFMTYGFEPRTGELRWTHRSGTPIVAILGSSRLPHVIVQAEIETFAIERRRRGRLAGRPLRRGDRRRARRRPARPDELRRPGDVARPEDRAARRGLIARRSAGPRSAAGLARRTRPGCGRACG